MSYTVIYPAPEEISINPEEGYVSAGLLAIGMKMRIVVDRHEGDDQDGVSEKIATISNKRIFRGFVFLDFENVKADESIHVSLTEFVKIH